LNPVSVTSAAAPDQHGYPASPVAEVDVVGDPPVPIVEDITPAPGIGLKAHGHGTVVGCGRQAIGIARHIPVQSGFRTVMLFTMDAIYSYEAVGNDADKSSAAVLAPAIHGSHASVLGSGRAGEHGRVALFAREIRQTTFWQIPICTGQPF